ncbi:PREDICTED: E3 ubiquitin-protein ligase MARCH6-like isoform X1 [Amphimedon queenslandica]|uniref:RING-type E3 ubiquitin transferase n=1 Tax=Amphimedon queenslandica TaxID=400682 RepID=A0AAN0K4M1_AMPQE|nr:PREDICTED: E3 ubiquitin-protein ligase MARCH6-like isoform X1 [Amphimedon queenslandica]|eukprot:XP_019864267.1 PREDICTED: E3 ubiquitin-protein ligase MARCH6-like isoform X1 [Amphimedon queenslandica]
MATAEDICRVCRLSGTSDRPLFHPCLCTGSIRYVHQDCLMQWLQHSRKEYCELCHYKFQFASIYRADMPRWLPVNYIYKTLVRGLNQRLQRWFHFCFVLFTWLYLLPVCTYRVYCVVFKGDFWGVITLPWELITFANLILEGLVGLFIVFVSLLAFISLVWLKDQLTTGTGPDWLTADQQEAQRQAEPTPRDNMSDDEKAKLINDAHIDMRKRQRTAERLSINESNKKWRKDNEKFIKELEDATAKRFYEEGVELRKRQMELIYQLELPMNHYMPALKAARLKNIEGIEKWKNDIVEDLKKKYIISSDVVGLPPEAAAIVDATPLPSLEERGLTPEQATLFELHQDRPVPITDESRKRELEAELDEVTNRLMELTVSQKLEHERIVHYLSMETLDSDTLDELSEGERDMIGSSRFAHQIYNRKFEDEAAMMAGHMAEVRVAHPVLMERTIPTWYQRVTGRNNNNDQQDQAEARRRRQNAPARPNIGQALVGLAREPQDPNAEALQADQLTKMLGLDGSYQFLEHVMWMLLLMTALLLIFGLIPNKVGQLFTSYLSIDQLAWNDNWRILFSTINGYVIVMILIVILYYVVGLFKLAKIKSFLGMAYLALKISTLLLLEAGIFPLCCGWWLDICSFSLLGTSLKARQASLNYAPGTVMFLHWLAGMIFIFYFASFVVLLREVLRPGVMWFLRNLNDQNFHPIQDMISQPFQKHFRRFLMSNIMFGVSILVLIYIPSRLVVYLFPWFLPYNLTLMSTVSPIREVQLELILLQFVIPTLLEHSNTRAAIKNGVIMWSRFMAKILKLDSYLLDNPQTGGVVVDMHGNVIMTLPYDPNWEGPVHPGPAEVLGPGFAPFKPYLRTKYFFLRVTILLFISVTSIITVSAAFLLGPVLLGRTLMGYIGLIAPPDIYTAAIGMYVVWVTVRVATAIISKTREGFGVIMKQLLLWTYQGMKCAIAGFLLFIVIPLLLGNLVDLLIISPIRVPTNRTPITYFSTVNANRIGGIVPVFGRL